MDYGGGGLNFTLPKMFKQRPIKHWLYALLLLSGVLICGFLQERIKVNINFVLEKGTSIEGFFLKTPEEKALLLNPIKSKGNFDYYYSHESLSFVYQIDESHLKILKWVITITSILIFTVLDLGIFWWFKVERPLYKYYFMLSGTLLFIGASVYALGVFTQQLNVFYPISRGILGVLQSPVLSLVLVPVFKKFNQTQNHGTI